MEKSLVEVNLVKSVRNFGRYSASLANICLFLVDIEILAPYFGAQILSVYEDRQCSVCAV